MADLPDPAFKLLPVPAKMKVGLKTLADLLTKVSDEEAHLKESGSDLLFIVEQCPECWQRTSDEAICHGSAGMLQEALLWLTDTDDFGVAETECVARGDDTCTFVISRKTEEASDVSSEETLGATAES